ncbi:MAG TPA: DegV family protein [Acidimicrobiia bacterium]|nr:DegV family protein [Acidimicrobiia bacterium]
MIRIVTDSSCDLPDGLVEQHRITIVPLTIRFGDDDYVDREELSTDRFWELLVAGEGLPETAAPSIGRFQEAFGRLSSEGADGIVVICLSSAISATHQAAVLAVEQYGGGIPIRVVDSGLVSGALGLVVLAAASAAESAGSIDAVEGVARDAAASTNLLATLDTLEYLKRGGRIGSAAAFFGNLLDVKPLISFQDGAVHAAGRVRTRRKAVAAIVERVAEMRGTLADLAIIHSDAADLAEFTTALAEVHEGTPVVMRLGPVVGTHAGPGVVGVVYREKQR